MGNMWQIITLISLLNLGCVLSQVVTWKETDREFIAREGGSQLQIPCHFAVPSNAGTFDYLVGLYKFQDIKYVETQERERREIDIKLGREVADAGSVKNDYRDIFDSNMELWTDSGSQLGENERRLTVTIRAPEPRDSGRYVCHIDHDGEVFQVVHTVTVLPRNRNNLISIELSGQSDITDDLTVFKDGNREMTYYSTDRNINGVLECKACDGASKPIVEISVGDRDLRGDVKVVDEVDVTFTNVNDDGLQLREMKWCVTRRSEVFRLTAEHSGMKLKCRAYILDENNAEYASAEVERTVLVYHEAMTVEGSCHEVQYSRRNSRGQMSCTFTAVPNPTEVTWVERNSGEEFRIDVGSGNGWSAAMQAEGSSYTAVLVFDNVDVDHYTDYYLRVVNEGGTQTFDVTFQEGEGQNQPVGGVTGIHCTLSLIVMSLLLTFKLMIL